MPRAQKRPATSRFGRKPIAPPVAAPVSKSTYRRGQLLLNSSLEELPILKGWQLCPGVDLVTAPEHLVHTGVAAARLGFVQPQAQLRQIINGITPGRYYQLSFFLAADHDSDNAPLLVSVDYLNINRIPIGKPALQTRIEQYSLNDVVYTGFLEYTRWPAPLYARFARITLEIDTTNYPQGAVLADDITMTGIL